MSQNRTTLPTEAEMDELLGKPGPAIEVDAASMAACVEASRQEARSQTTHPTYVDRLDLHEGPVETNHEPLNRKFSGKLHKTTYKRKVVVDLLASLVAAVSLLKRSSKKAAPSDRMFDQMIADYERSIAHGRAYLVELENQNAPE